MSESYEPFEGTEMCKMWIYLLFCTCSVSFRETHTSRLLSLRVQKVIWAQKHEAAKTWTITQQENS
jgi:hypothetical protein